jgi:hypothetical protein
LRAIIQIGVAAVAALGARETRAADPTTADCLAASLASLKLGNEHKVRQERAQLLVCAATSCPADIRKECMRRVDEVNAAVPTVIFAVKDGAGNDLSEVKVTMDGEVLAERLEGTALSIDPGPHAFVFEAPNLPRVEKHFVIQQAQKDRREAIVLGAPAAVDPPPPGGEATHPTATNRPAETETMSPPASDSSTPTKAIVGYSLMCVGVIGVGVGIAEQVTALGRSNDSQSASASSSAAVRATAHTIHDQAAQAQTYAIVFGAAGVAAIGGGLFLVLTAHPSSGAPAKSASTASWRVVPAIGPQSAGLTIAGTF